MFLKKMAKLILEGGANTVLDIGTIDDGDVIKRSGTTIEGVSASGTGTKEFAVFDLGGTGASFSSGALTFTPEDAFTIYENSVNMGFGYGNGTGTADQTSIEFSSIDGSQVTNGDSMVNQGVSTIWHFTAFSSGGITVTRRTGTGTMNHCILVVYGT